jgi:hypothetical protein
MHIEVGNTGKQNSYLVVLINITKYYYVIRYHSSSIDFVNNLFVWGKKLWRSKLVKSISQIDGDISQSATTCSRTHLRQQTVFVLAKFVSYSMESEIKYLHQRSSKLEPTLCYHCEFRSFTLFREIIGLYSENQRNLNTPRGQDGVSLDCKAHSRYSVMTVLCRITFPLCA